MSVSVTVNPSMVREIITTTLTDNEIEADIASALTIYNNFLVNKSISYDLGLEIKRYLAAHFVSIKDPSTRITEERIGDAVAKYRDIEQPGFGAGLASTRWGQAAMTFDPTGILSQLGKRAPRWYAL